MIRIVTLFSIFLFVMSIPELDQLSVPNTCSPWVESVLDDHSTEMQDVLDLSLIGTETLQRAYQIFNKQTGKMEINFFTCEPWNTCVGRCNQKTDLRINYPPYTCYCDAICTRYKDCCVDYIRHCLKGDSNQTSETKGPIRSKQLHFSCMDLNGKYGILMVDKCDVAWLDGDTREKCETNQIDPVTDYEGFMYKNGYCAVCNGINYDSTIHWETQRICTDRKGNETECKVEYVSSKKTKFNPRKCVYDIGNCSSSFDFPDKFYQDIALKCKSYSGMVLGWNSEEEFKYKNPHCALCNIATRVTCPQWRWMFNVANRFGKDDKHQQTHEWATKLYGKHNKTPPIEDFQVQLVKKEPMAQREIPPAVSVLFNFGLNGKKNFYFSSNQGHQSSRNTNNCPSDHIWDPFLDICRSLSCTAHFSLIDYQCVETANNSTERNLLSDLIFGINLNKVVVCMAFQVKSIAGEENMILIEKIMQNLSPTLAGTLGINNSRISNMMLLNKTYSIGRTGRSYLQSKRPNAYERECEPLLTAFDFSCRRTIAVRFELSEPERELEGFEPSIDRIISLLITNVNMNTMSLLLDGFSLRLLGIHEETVVEGDEFQNWCLDGEKSKYMNHEFTILNGTIVNDDWKMNIFINKTGKMYKKGEYLANFISIGKSGSNDLTSVNGIVVVCENRSKLLPDSCPRLKLNRDEYEFNSNGTVSYIGELPIGKSILNFGEYQVDPDGSLQICYNVSTNPGLVMEFDALQAYIGLILMSISLFAMAITFFTYSLFSKLRTLPGTNLMNLVFILFLSQLTYLIGMRSWSVKGLACKIVAIVLHYEILCSFFWTNVMAYDLFKTFGHNNILPFIREKKKFMKYYMAYAYLCPAAVVSIPIAIDTCKCTGDFYVGYGDYFCWINNPWANVIFFALPIVILLVINFTFYLITICSISKITKTVKAATNKRGESDVNLYIRMSSVLGFTWVFGFAAQLTTNVVVGTVLTYTFVLTHSLQGLFICWAFVCNKRIFNLYKPYGERILDTFRKPTTFLPFENKKGTGGWVSSTSSIYSRSSSLQTSTCQLSDY